MSKPQAITDFAPDSFAAMFEESLKSSEMRSGEVITAEVVRVEHSFVVVNAGLKSEAYVPIEEFKNDQGELEVQPGDFVYLRSGLVRSVYVLGAVAASVIIPSANPSCGAHGSSELLRLMSCGAVSGARSQLPAAHAELCAMSAK